MSIEEFLSVLKQIVNEFRILNEHFDSKNNSKTGDYDQVFSNWTRDMVKRYRSMPLAMHWATSSPLISKNQILFDIRYQDEYTAEIKYQFDQAFVHNFAATCGDMQNTLYLILKSFEKLNESHDVKASPSVGAYEAKFLEWKKQATSTLTNVVLDFHWANKLDQLILNPLFITIMFSDDFLFEIKYKFANPDQSIGMSPIETAFDDDLVI